MSSNSCSPIRTPSPTPSAQSLAAGGQRSPKTEVVEKANGVAGEILESSSRAPSPPKLLVIPPSNTNTPSSPLSAAQGDGTRPASPPLVSTPTPPIPPAPDQHSVQSTSTSTPPLPAPAPAPAQTSAKNDNWVYEKTIVVRCDNQSLVIIAGSITGLAAAIFFATLD